MDEGKKIKRLKDEIKNMKDYERDTGEDLTLERQQLEKELKKELLKEKIKSL